jgi:hypothetical protein
MARTRQQHAEYMRRYRARQKTQPAPSPGVRHALTTIFDQWGPQAEPDERAIALALADLLDTPHAAGKPQAAKELTAILTAIRQRTPATQAPTPAENLENIRQHALRLVGMAA